MTSMLKAEGIIRCSLKRPSSDQTWWMVLACSTEEIGRYYRHLYWLDCAKGSKLSKPYWNSHVTVVRNEEPPNNGRWWDYDGELVEFHYIPGVDDNYSNARFRSFYWLNVICPRFEEIREELGLHKNPDGIYHMTIGSIENEANRHIYEAMWRKE